MVFATHPGFMTMQAAGADTIPARLWRSSRARVNLGERRIPPQSGRNGMRQDAERPASFCNGVPAIVFLNRSPLGRRRLGVFASPCNRCYTTMRESVARTCQLPPAPAARSNGSNQPAIYSYAGCRPPLVSTRGAPIRSPSPPAPGVPRRALAPPRRRRRRGRRSCHRQRRAPPMAYRWRRTPRRW